MGISTSRIIKFPKICDPRGNLSFIENSKQIPFDIKRVYYLYDIPGGSERAGHAHISLQQVLIALAGSFDVLLDDGHAKKEFTMNRSNYGLLITPGIWRVLNNFSYGSVCLSLASDFFDEEDYIRNYEDFLARIHG